MQVAERWRQRHKHLDAEESQGPPGELGRQVLVPFGASRTHSVETLTLDF